MYERHCNEQYFFDEATLDHLAQFVSGFENPCCLCCPMLGQHLSRRGVAATVLDVDQRFSVLPGFKSYDIARPHWLGAEFGLILCDPPFFNISLSQLFKTIRLLSRHDFGQPLLLCYLTRRIPSVLSSFARFGLEATGYYPAYQTLQQLPRNEIEFFGNLGVEEHTRLRTINL